MTMSDEAERLGNLNEKVMAICMEARGQLHDLLIAQMLIQDGILIAVQAG